MLFNTFWDARVKIAKVVGVCLLIGLLIGLLSAEEYETNAVLMPESQTQSQFGGLLQQYGGLLGISNGGNTLPSGSISPLLYPNIVQSIPYQLELLNKPVYFSKYDTTVTVHQFFNGVYSPSVLDYIKRFTIGLPKQLSSIFRKEDQQSSSFDPDFDKSSVLSLSKNQMETIKILRDRLTVTTGDEGLLTYTVELPDPQASAEVGKAGLELLKEYVREYRTQKAYEDLQFVREQVKEAKKRFEEAQRNLAEFRDSNLNLATAKAQTREQELKSRYDLTFDIYNSLNQRLEQAKINVQEDTPVFSILQPIMVPLEKSSPKRLLILILSGAIGLIISTGWVLLKFWWKGIKE